MDFPNRKFLNHTFTSEYFNPSISVDDNDQNEDVDFYIFFKKDVSFDNILAFHVPYAFINEFANSYIHSEEEEFIIDIILHHQLVDYINDPDTSIEQIYLSLIEYLCYGQESGNKINSYSKGGFGIIVLFDEDYHFPSITSVIEPSINLSKFHLE